MERDYVLGTHDEEIARLRLQHRVWRARVLEAWRGAGFAPGQTLLDIGCGPGYAALDLAEIVGPGGRIVAIDRSQRFLQALAAACRERALDNVTTLERDLDQPGLPTLHADGAWVRWVFAFVQRPRELLAEVAGALKPSGALVVHEYFDYASWRLLPRSAEMEEFVRAVMASWRESGGEPDIGLALPAWLRELGFEIRSLRPILDVVSPASEIWQWPRTFLQVGLKRLVALGRLSQARAQSIRESFEAREAAPHTLMATPAVLEIVAGRPRSGA